MMPRSARYPDGRPRRQRRQARLASAGLTRRALVPWDRLKFIFLLVAAWFIVVWYQMGNDPVLGFTDAARQQLQLRSGVGRWLILLLALEVIRQFSYLVAEHSKGYYRASNAFFGGTERVSYKMSDYTRFRLARVTKWLIVLAVVAVMLHPPSGWTSGMTTSCPFSEEETRGPGRRL